MPCSWKGNRRSGIPVAMCRRLQWFIRLRAHGLRKAPRIHSSRGIPLFTFRVRDGPRQIFAMVAVEWQVFEGHTPGRQISHIHVITVFGQTGLLFLHGHLSSIYILAAKAADAAATAAVVSVQY